MGQGGLQAAGGALSRSIKGPLPDGSQHELSDPWRFMWTAKRVLLVMFWPTAELL